MFWKFKLCGCIINIFRNVQTGIKTMSVQLVISFLKIYLYFIKEVLNSLINIFFFTICFWFNIKLILISFWSLGLD